MPGPALSLGRDKRNMFSTYQRSGKNVVKKKWDSARGPPWSKSFGHCLVIWPQEEPNESPHPQAWHVVRLRAWARAVDLDTVAESPCKAASDEIE